MRTQDGRVIWPSECKREVERLEAELATLRKENEAQIKRMSKAWKEDAFRYYQREEALRDELSKLRAKYSWRAWLFGCVKATYHR
jgi:hypothetical protein